MSKKSVQKLKYLENEKSFWGEKKAFFIIFKGLSVVKSRLRPESAPLRFSVSFAKRVTQIVIIEEKPLFF